jgi:hypothetical protein
LSELKANGGLTEKVGPSFFLGFFGGALPAKFNRITGVVAKAVV